MQTRRLLPASSRGSRPGADCTSPARAALVCAALAIAASVAITGCGGSSSGAHAARSATSKTTSGAETTRPSSSPRPAVPQLTLGQARQAFNAFFPAYRAMIKTHDTKAALDLTTGAEGRVQQFGTAHELGLPVNGPMSETLYVPRLRGYPRWFVATGTIRSGPSVNVGQLFVVVQARQGAAWRAAEALTWFGPPGIPLSSIATDARGYATAVPADDSGLLTPPAQLPARYGELLGAADSASLFAAGDGTTGWTARQRQVVADASANGWQVRFGYRGWTAPIFALATKNGGALVFFGFDQNSAWTATSPTPRFSGGVSSFDGRMPIDLAVLAGLSSPRLKPGTRIDGTYTYETAAFDPPRGAGRISLPSSDVLGGGVTRASLSTRASGGAA